jgi:hypothetical protein
MDRTQTYRMLAGIIVFGSVWGLLECGLGGIKFTGALEYFPMGALLAGVFGLGLMAYSRRLFGVKGMQLSIALIAALLRFIAPIGNYVLCSALAIIIEGAVFELIFFRPVLNLNKIRSPWTLGFIGIISGYFIYIAGYMFTQAMTPVVAGTGFVAADFAAALPLILGRGFFAAIFGGITLPVVVLSKYLSIDVYKVDKKHYYPTLAATSICCWALVVVLFPPVFL